MRTRLSVFVLAVLLGTGCSLVSRQPSDGKIMLSPFGSVGLVPVHLKNDEDSPQVVRAVRYDLYVSDQKVTSGRQTLQEEIPPDEERTVQVEVDLDEDWLFGTPGFTQTASVPYVLRGVAEVGDREVPCSSEGTLRMRSTRKSP